MGINFVNKSKPINITDFDYDKVMELVTKLETAANHLSEANEKIVAASADMTVAEDNWRGASADKMFEASVALLKENNAILDDLKLTIFKLKVKAEEIKNADDTGIVRRK